MRRATTSGLLGRYFLHGIFFSLLMSVMLIAWAFILGLLIAFGFIIGLIFGLVLLFIAIGAINAFVTENVWDVRMETSLGTDLAHGLVLFIILLVVSFPVSIVFDYLGPATDMMTFLVRFISQTIIMAFIDGYVAKAIAGSFGFGGRRV